MFDCNTTPADAGNDDQSIAAPGSSSDFLYINFRNDNPIRVSAARVGGGIVRPIGSAIHMGKVSRGGTPSNEAWRMAA